MKLLRRHDRSLLTPFLLALLLTLTIVDGAGAKSSATTATGESGYLIQLEGAPLATYQGTVAGLAATNPRAAGTRKFDSRSTAARLYRDHLGRKRVESVARMEASLGRTMRIKHHYDTAFNGLAVQMTASEAARVAKVRGVLRVVPDRQVKARWAGGGKESPGAVAASTSGQTFLIFAGLMVLVTLWGAARSRKLCSWLWVVVSTVLLLLTAACGGSHEEETATRKVVTVEAPIYLHPSPGAAWIGAQGVWTGAETGGLPATMGEGVVVGIIDSGINPHSPSFAAIGGDGYLHSNPRGKFYGVCDPENQEIFNPNVTCNTKLIGAWSYIADDFNHSTGNIVDFNGHGSHVAATAAGNIVQEVTLSFANGFALTTDISGVAPHANIISYRVLGADGSGLTSGILAGIEQAIKDGVDVINLSLGGGLYDPWTDIIYGLPLLNAREAGIFVAVAAGNDGPAAATIDTPGVVPWVTSVGASTHDTSYINKLSLTGGPTMGAEIRGLGITIGYGPAPIVYAGDFGDPLCQGTFTAGFHGEIIICDRGENGRREKGGNVRANGGGGMVLAEVNPGGAENLVAEEHFLPTVHITQADAGQLNDWLAQGTGHVATISGTTADVSPEHADLVAGFSSRGLNLSAADNIKPDILAPGTDILAPVVDGVGYASWQGTSMASPHVAGVYALLKALHPEWTPAEAQSAIMTTARQGATLDDAGTTAPPFAAGAGRIDAGRAARAALVLDETSEGFQQADPTLYWESTESGLGLTSAMNLASLGNGSAIGRCSWSRRVRSVSSQRTSWTATMQTDPGLLLTVVPESFSLAPGESIEITVTADLFGAPRDEWAFGRVLLTEAAGKGPGAGLPVAVRSQDVKLPPSLEIVTDQANGAKQFYRLEATRSSDLALSVAGLIPAVIVEDVIDSDPTPSDPGNNDGGIYLLSVEVPAEAVALFVNLESAVAPDLDLYVGRDGSWEPLASSGNGESSESVLLAAPEAGTWWIAIHGCAPGRMADPFTLHYGVVTATDANRDNLTVIADKRDGSPFSLSLNWNLPDSAVDDDWYGAVQLGTSVATPESIGTIPVRLQRRTTPL